MSIIITGADGYLGWPTALDTALSTDQRVIAVDNLARRDWVEEVGARSAVPIEDPDTRMEEAPNNLSFIEADLSDRDFVERLVEVHDPDAVVHLAAQPSAPYSQINGERANYTQENNMAMTRNLAWALDGRDAHLIVTTTTGIYGAPHFPIPEGGIHVERGGGEDDLPFPAMGGSWYHQSRSHDAANLRLARKQFDLDITEVRTAIVTGSRTHVTSELNLPTRLDFDYYFGTVAHRFCAQAVAGYPLTVYGKGQQRKPFVTLEQAAESLTNLATGGFRGEEVLNQVTEAISIVGLAEMIKNTADELGLETEVKHYENPRDEDETHRMEIENEKFKRVAVPGSMEQAITETLKDLNENQEIVKAYEDRFLPGVLTE